jgi:hypothetical protein
MKAKINPQMGSREGAVAGTPLEPLFPDTILAQLASLKG